MIPVSYIMVDLGGIDLADVKGNVYPGLYNKIYSSLNECQEVILCNWFVAGILIPPAYCYIDISVSGIISFNDIIFIYSDDTIQIPTMGTTPITEQLSVSENGTYEVPEGVDGFNPVHVQVPGPVLQALEVTENGDYTPSSGVDGFNSVSVDVNPPLQSKTATENGSVTPDAGYYGLSSVLVNILSSDNNLLYHFDTDFINSGNTDSAFINNTGLIISDKQAKFGVGSLKTLGSQTINTIDIYVGFSLTNQDFTFDFWCYPTSLPTGATTYVVPAAFKYRSLAIYLNQNSIQFGLAKSNASWFNIDSNAVTISENTWHHIAVVRNGAEIYGFLDGVKIKTVNFGTDNFAPLGNLTLGSNTYNSGDRRFSGYIDEVRFRAGFAAWTADFTPPNQPYN